MISASSVAAAILLSTTLPPTSAAAHHLRPRVAVVPDAFVVVGGGWGGGGRLVATTTTTRRRDDDVRHGLLVRRVVPCLAGDAMPSSSSLSQHRRSGTTKTTTTMISAMTATEDDDDYDYDGEDDDAVPDLILERGTWMFRGVHPISYEVASVGVDERSSSADESVVPILLLNGFGVGTFHQHRLMRKLLLEGRRRTRRNRTRDRGNDRRRVGGGTRYLVYGVDYLGQGRSWPTECDDGRSANERDLDYSADTWLEQLGGFLEEVVVPSSSSSVGEVGGVHLVGNSVGGYLATMLSRRHPSLISSLALLNATPVWGLNLPGWDGRLPPPPLPRFVGRGLFDAIRDAGVIDAYLKAAYVHGGAFDGTFRDGFDDDEDEEEDDGRAGGATKSSSSSSSSSSKAGAGALGARIRACTEGRGGHAAFASILWSAPASEGQTTYGPRDDADDGKLRVARTAASPSPTPADFYRVLADLEVDVLLLFGANDPWCTPAIAKRMHASTPSSTSSSRGRSDDEIGTPARRYISLENVGHCPNHEAPTAVARVLLPWIDAASSKYDGDDCRRSGSRRDVPLVSGDAERVSEPWGVVGIREVPIEESRNLSVVDRIVSYMVG